MLLECISTLCYVLLLGVGLDMSLQLSAHKDRIIRGKNTASSRVGALVALVRFCVTQSVVSRDKMGAAPS